MWACVLPCRNKLILIEYSLWCTEPGERVLLQPYNGGSTQQWAVEGKVVRNRGTGEVLDIVGQSHDDSAEVCSYTDKNMKNQQWRVEYTK